MATAERTLTVPEVAARAHRAARALATLPTETKNAALAAIAEALEARAAEILAPNRLDLEAGRAAGLAAALMDRLALDEQRIAAMAEGVRDIVSLPDPVGEEIEHRSLPNGLEVNKVRVPLGVVAVIYEARPNVTVDSAALCLKSGNAVILRGSSTAAHSNAVLGAVITAAGVAGGLPEGAISQLGGGGREELVELITQEGLVDLAIPRGGEGLKATLKAHATVPVLYAASGNCHVYVDASADPDMARAIAVNAKVQRPGVCNAAETLLVHAEAAPAALPAIFRELREAGVELRTDARARSLAGPAGDGLAEATEEDWGTEYHDLILAVRVVDSVEEAIEHVNTYGTGHSDAIVTASDEAARAFTEGVDSACVYVNASTRFTDGAEFGMGAEIGNSTQKLHARGPIGLRELCTFKYVVRGSGQVRS